MMRMMMMRMGMMRGEMTRIKSMSKRRRMRGRRIMSMRRKMALLKSTSRRRVIRGRRKMAGREKRWNATETTHKVFDLIQLSVDAKLQDIVSTINELFDFINIANAAAATATLSLPFSMLLC